MDICNMCTVDGCGRDGQEKYAICDACRQCHSILSILSQFFNEFDRFVAPTTCFGALYHIYYSCFTNVANVYLLCKPLEACPHCMALACGLLGNSPMYVSSTLNIDLHQYAYREPCTLNTVSYHALKGH